MSNKEEVYQCDICKMVVKVLEGGQGQLVCCGQPMTIQEQKYTQKT